VNRVFISYSHEDETLRNKLDVHLMPLKREGVIDIWHDRSILAGQEFAGVIDNNLATADVILLLVSPDFIASDYCYQIEMDQAMERHQTGSAQVIPVILRPCDWHSLPFGKLAAVPKDGKPVVKYPNWDDAFLEVAQAVRRISEARCDNARKSSASAPTALQKPTAVPTPVQKPIRSGNLSIKKEFDDFEKDHFLDESFEYLACYFEGSLAELKNRNTGIETRYRRIDTNSFEVAIYKGGLAKAQCCIWICHLFSSRGGICYLSGRSRPSNGFNEQLHVEDNGYHLFLKSMGMLSFGQARDQQLTQEGAAEYLWESFIKPLQQ